MQLLRTTVRLHPALKKTATAKALELDISFQDLLGKALEDYLRNGSRQKARKIVFQSRSLGRPLDNLDREKIYADRF